MVVENIPHSKVCTKCKIEKQFNLFSKLFISKDGLQFMCKACRKLEAAARYTRDSEKIKAKTVLWRADHQEKLHATQTAYRLANQEKTRASTAHYRAKNKEKLRVSGVKWRQDNKEKIRVNAACYRASNKEKIRIQNNNRRAMKLAAGGKLSNGLTERLYKLQRGKCACCGEPLGKNFHRDHIMPLALGGNNTDDNIQLLRQICNNQKHTKHPIDFMQERGFLL